MTLDEILSDLQNKVFCRSADISEFTKVEQILLEALRIEMDVNDETLGGH